MSLFSKLFKKDKKDNATEANILADLVASVLTAPIENTLTLFQKKLLEAHSFLKNGNEEMALKYFSAIKAASLQLIIINKVDEERFETLNCATEAITFSNEIYILRDDYSQVISNAETDLLLMSDFLPLCSERFKMLLRVLQFYSQLLHTFKSKGCNLSQIAQKVNDLASVISSYVEYVDAETQRALLNNLCDFTDRLLEKGRSYADGLLSMALYQEMNWSELSQSNFREAGLLLGKLAILYLDYPEGEKDTAERICNDEIKLLKLKLESENTLRSRYDLAIATSHLASVALKYGNKDLYISTHLKKIQALRELIETNSTEDIDELITRKVLSDSIDTSIRNITEKLDKITSEYSVRILESLTYELFSLHLCYRENIHTIEAANELAQVLTTVYVCRNDVASVEKFSRIKLNNLFSLISEFGMEIGIIKDVKNIYSLVQKFVEEHKDEFSDSYLQLYNLAAKLQQLI